MTPSAAELARLAPSGLAALATRARWARPAHVALLERRLLDVAAGRCRRLRVALPPRHGKSELVARFFLAWWLMSNPTLRAILVCATAALAETYSRKVRDLVLEFGPMFGAHLRADSRAVERWELVEGGGLTAAGAGSSVVGRGAHLLVADDVVSGHEVAASKAQLEKLVSWFQRDIYTRLEPDGAAVVCGTRWAQRDLHGTLDEDERAGGEAWASVVLPALAEEGDALGRAPGEALWPARYPAAELARIRSALGSVAFAGLYQQRPVPEGGGLFKTSWARRYRREGDFVVVGEERVAARVMTRFLTVDTATSESARADYTAIAAWGAHAGRLFLLDLDMRRLDGPKVAEAIKASSKKHDAFAWIEETTGSKHLLAFLKREGVVFRTLKPDSSKLARAIPASALMEQGRFFMPERADWLDAYETQLYGFVGGLGGAAHDDAVDVTSYAVQILNETVLGAELWQLTSSRGRPRPVLDGCDRPASGDPFAGVALPVPPSFGVEPPRGGLGFGLN